MKTKRTAHRSGIRATGAVAAVVALSGALAACGGDSLEEKGGKEGGGGGKSIVIGSAGFTEHAVLANLYKGLLDDAGYNASIKKVKNRELYEPALEKGQIHVVPEYAATMAEFLNAKENGAEAPEKNPVASSDVDKTVTALQELSEKRGLKALAAGKAVDQNAFVASKEWAEKNNLKTLTDLGKSGLEVNVAAGEECSERPFCAPGLKDTYGIKVGKIDPKGVSTPQSKQSVKEGTNQLALTNSTDATLDQFGLVILEDDKKLQNADNVLPVVNADKAGDKKVTNALDKLNRVLTSQDLIDLSKKVDAERAKPEDAAADYLKEKGLVK
ncbi:ABC transporter substrate-binding protein [Streptomyces coryli]|uniref:ABC transporter substrate-binding protein n=1 Tax=Streptomyces coryli TaxID=1128680 RepID=UPI001F10DB49|nr:ABC transporter substrate-binding protein [Streptomyces coryli]